MTEREAQIEALWTYEISHEKVLKRGVKKGYITQAEADEFSEKLFEQLNLQKIPGFRLSSLGEKDAHRRFVSQRLCLADGNT